MIHITHLFLIQRSGCNMLELKHGMDVSKIRFRDPSIGTIIRVEKDEYPNLPLYNFDVYYDCSKLNITRHITVTREGYYLTVEEGNRFDIVEYNG